MSTDERPRIRCVLCGRAVLRSCIRGHVTSEACLIALGRDREGEPYHPTRGPLALRLARELAKVCGEI